MFCGNCGAQINDGVAFCPMCGNKTASVNNNQPIQQPDNQFYKPTVSNPKNSKKNFKILPVIVVIAVVILVGAVIAKGASGASSIKTMLGLSSETYEVFGAAKKTIFESESATIDVDTPYDENVTVDVQFGKNVNDSKLYLEFKEDGDVEGVLGILDNILYLSEEGEGDIDELLEEGLEDYFEFFSIKENPTSLLDQLIDQKISEAAFEDLYNTIGRDAIADYIKLMSIYNRGYDYREQFYNESKGVYDVSSIKLPFEIPDYDTVMDVVKEFLIKGISDEAVFVEKDGKSYRYEIYVGEFFKCLLDFAKEDETVSTIIDGVVEMLDADLDEIYEELEEEIEYYLEDDDEKIKGEYVIEDGYLTYLKVRMYGDNFSITAKNIGKTKVDENKIEGIDTEGYYSYY